MVGIFFSTKLNIPQTQLGLPRLRSSLRNATTWLADRLYQLDRWIVYHLLYCQHHHHQHYMTTSPTSPHDYKQARSPSRPGSSSLESWGEFSCFPFFAYEAVSDQGPVWVRSEEKIPSGFESTPNIIFSMPRYSLVTQLSEEVWHVNSQN